MAYERFKRPDPADASASPRAAERPRNAPGSPVILLVDDDDPVRETSADMLQELGHSVLQAASGDEALLLLDQHHGIDVMVTDVRMPGMSGLELSEIAGRRFRDLRIILISGYFLPQQISRRFLQKPFRIRDLDKAIRAEQVLLANI